LREQRAGLASKVGGASGGRFISAQDAVKGLLSGVAVRCGHTLTFYSRHGFLQRLPQCVAVKRAASSACSSQRRLPAFLISGQPAFPSYLSLSSGLQQQRRVMPRSISPQKPHTASDLWHTGPGPHIQLPCRTACRRCLELPEPRALAPALCSVAAVGTVQSDSRAWHTARDLRSLLQPFHFSWTGLSPSRTPPRQFALAPCCSRRALRSLLTLAPLLPQMPDTHNTHPKNHSAGGRHW